MDVQCIIEEAWAKVNIFHNFRSKQYNLRFRLRFHFQGEQTLDLSKSKVATPLTINFCNLTQVRQPNGPTRNIRRMQQAPYPLTKLPPPSAASALPQHSRNGPSIVVNVIVHSHSQPNVPQLPATPQKATNSKSNSTKSSPPTSSNGGGGNGKRSHKQSKSKQNANNNNNNDIESYPTSTSTSTNLARQFLNNLNIFGTKSTTHLSAQQHQQQAGTVGAPSSSSQHHHHQQQQNQSTASATTTSNGCHQNKLTSMGTAPSYHRTDSHRSRSRTRSDHYTDNESMKSVRRPSVDTVSTYLSHESKESSLSRNIGSVSDLLDCSIGSDDVFVPPPPPRPQQIAGSIVGVDAASDTISRFVRVVDPPKWPNAQPCPMCLDELRHNSQNPAISLSRCQHLMHLQCLNELIIIQQQDAYKSLYIECPVCGIVYGEKIGNQPAGTMTWIIIPKNLPGHEGQNTIQIVYKYVGMA